MAAGNSEYPTQDWDDYYTRADDGLEFRVRVKAGTRVLGVAFVGKSWEQEGILQPSLREYGATVTEATDTSPKVEGPGLESVAIDGPYDVTGTGETASREKIFVCRPATSADEDTCATTILTTLARRAYRRPVTDADIQPLLGFYEIGRAEGTFDAGIQTALERILIDPEFLFRIERDPDSTAPGDIYRLTDLELASRLSFFVWSSIPGRHAARRRRPGGAQRSGRPRATGASDAGGSPLEGVGGQLRRPMADAPQRAGLHARPEHLPRVR